MKYIHRSEDRFKTQIGWLNGRHSFNFNRHFSPEKTGFGALLVLNEDRIAPHQGFGMHPHNDMEIITIPLSGEVQHEDDQGGKGILKPFDVQVMSAGTGIFHSETNPSHEELHLLQIWIIPDKTNHAPHYDEKHIPLEENTLTTLVGPMDSKTPLHIHQDAYIHRIKGEDINHTHQLKKPAYCFLVEGELTVNDTILKSGDAVGIVGEAELSLQGQGDLIILEVPY